MHLLAILLLFLLLFDPQVHCTRHAIVIIKLLIRLLVLVVALLGITIYKIWHKLLIDIVLRVVLVLMLIGIIFMMVCIERDDIKVLHAELSQVRRIILKYVFAILLFERFSKLLLGSRCE